MTNTSHDPRREFEQVLCVAAACGSSDDAQAQTPAGNKAAASAMYLLQLACRYACGIMSAEISARVTHEP